jgi:hypothetical protein
MDDTSSAKVRRENADREKATEEPQGPGKHTNGSLLRPGPGTKQSAIGLAKPEQLFMPRRCAPSVLT